MSRWQIHKSPAAVRAARTRRCAAIGSELSPHAASSAAPLLYFPISSKDAPRGAVGRPCRPSPRILARGARVYHVQQMIIDASHPEETRVVVLRGNRVEEFDFESASKRPLRGNIYLAKVTRVEPSLQAAFIEYGGNRHGFLAFRDPSVLYQIPVADRQRCSRKEARAQREEEDEAGGESRSRRHRRPRRPEVEARAEDAETVAEPALAESSSRTNMFRRRLPRIPGRASPKARRRRRSAGDGGTG